MTLSHLKISLWVLGKEPERRGLKERNQIEGSKGGRTLAVARRRKYGGTDGKVGLKSQVSSLMTDFWEKT